MKILVVCMKYEYGIIKRGLSYEYINFYTKLVNMGHDVIFFDFIAETQSAGKAAMNKKLFDLVEHQKPDLTFFTLYIDEFEPEMVHKLRTYTKTLCFFHDDTWRVDFSRYWASKFDYFTTPDVYGEYKYNSLGLHSAIYFPFGCNQDLFKKMDLPKKFDVSFVGSWHPYREWLISNLRRAGFSVEVAGFGWPNGALDHPGMVRLFNASKISLNLSNSSSWDIRYLCSSPRALINTLRTAKTIEQLKARHFEISSCGTFQLSYYVEGLERHYIIGEEIGIYIDAYDLIQKVRFYLDNETLREQIAMKAQARSLLHHGFESRFNEVFKRMGLDEKA